MNLESMLEAQKILEAQIIKEKGLEGQDLFPNTVLALQVELAEFAQEGRWFKHWSNNQTPRTKAFRGPFIDLEDSTEYNPLLEEYVDSVHFFLSIANQKGWQDALYVNAFQLDGYDFDGNLTGHYLEMVYFLNKSYYEIHSDEPYTAGFSKNEHYFRTAWILFLNIGINGFGFTPEQIEQAYYAKNAVNHHRQEVGY